MVTSANSSPTYHNVMESFVTQEVEKQLALLSPRLKPYVNKVEVMTYAMNRLPAMYASCERGWHWQAKRTQQEFGDKIKDAVRQAIAAVQRDLLRTETPLHPSEPAHCRTALEQLKELFPHQDITWETLADVIEQALVKAAEGEIVWKPKRRLPPKGYRWQGQQLIKINLPSP